MCGRIAAEPSFVSTPHPIRAMGAEAAASRTNDHTESRCAGGDSANPADPTPPARAATEGAPPPGERRGSATFHRARPVIASHAADRCCSRSVAAGAGAPTRRITIRARMRRCSSKQTSAC